MQETPPKTGTPRNFPADALDGEQSHSFGESEVLTSARNFRLSVVVGTLNRLDSLRVCVESIQAQTKIPTIVYVVDAGSTDGTVEYLQSIASDTLVPVLDGRKIGQAKSYNNVFKRVKTEYVAWLSDDNEVVSGGLDVAVAILDRVARIGMVALKVRDVQGPFVDAAYIGGISETGILNVNQGVLRSTALREAEYFSELFGFYGIDPDLTAKILYLGHDVVYTKQIALHHYRTWDMDPGSQGHATLKAHHKRSIELYKKKYGHLAGRDSFWATKKSIWQRITKSLRKRKKIEDRTKILFCYYRDWNNVFKARYISVLDPLLTAFQVYHLRQRVPRRDLPGGLPPEPMED